MDIRFVSTLTADDESQFAPALLRAATALLDAMPIAYTLRRETQDGEVFQHTQQASSGQATADPHAGNSVPIRR